MDITLSDKTYKIYMGLDFIRYLDAQQEAKLDFGISFSTGVAQLMADIEQGSPLGLVHFIQAGTCTEPKSERPTEKEIEEGILKSKPEEVQKLFLSLKEALQTSPMTAQMLQGYQNIMDQLVQQIVQGVAAKS